MTANTCYKSVSMSQYCYNYLNPGTFFFFFSNVIISFDLIWTPKLPGDGDNWEPLKLFEAHFMKYFGIWIAIHVCGQRLMHWIWSIVIFPKQLRFRSPFINLAERYIILSNKFRKYSVLPKIGQRFWFDLPNYLVLETIGKRSICLEHTLW